MNDEFYRELACAIIKSAVDDITGTSKANKLNRDNAIDFLKSEYCVTLTGIDGNMILEGLRKRGYDV